MMTLYQETIKELSKMAWLCDNNGDIKKEVCDKIEPSNPDALENLTKLLVNTSSDGFDLKYISFYYVDVNIEIIKAYYNQLKRYKKLKKILGE